MPCRVVQWITATCRTGSRSNYVVVPHRDPIRFNPETCSQTATCTVALPVDPQRHLPAGQRAASGRQGKKPVEA